MNCSIEPDLEDEVVYPGFEFGAHCVCDKCKPRELDQDFWDIYNGFKKRN